MNREKERYDYFVQNIRQYGDFPEVLEKHTWEFISDLLKKRDEEIKLQIAACFHYKPEIHTIKMLKKDIMEKLSTLNTK